MLLFIRLVCYKLPGNNITTLSDLISQKSELLTPDNIQQIVQDVEEAVNSLQIYSIIHSNINIKTVFISIPAMVCIALPNQNYLAVNSLQIYSIIHSNINIKPVFISIPSMVCIALPNQKLFLTNISVH